MERETVLYNEIKCTYLKTVVGPGSKLHDARLLVKWKILYVDLTRRLVDGRRLPFHAASVVECSLRCQSDFKVSVSAENKLQSSA
jgi:hypothetical protein